MSGVTKMAWQPTVVTSNGIPAGECFIKSDPLTEKRHPLFHFFLIRLHVFQQCVPQVPLEGEDTCRCGLIRTA